MERFTKIIGVVAPFPDINVDTDMIIPKDYMKTIRRSGLSVGLFADLRYSANGALRPDFVLNKPAYQNASILVAGGNFGCGSSREHAPWALLGFGIRCIISTGFADILYNNCFKNGILPIIVAPVVHEKLMADACRGSNAVLSVDLEDLEITDFHRNGFAFEVDAFRRRCLLNGLDEIAPTLTKASSIEEFEKRHEAARPWLDL